MTSLSLLFASDGYQLVIGGLLRTFTALPIGGGLDMAAPVQAMTTAVTQMFLADVGLGLLTRVAPALNAFAMGFPLKIFLTLTLAGVVFTALPRVVSVLSGQAFNSLGGVR